MAEEGGGAAGILHILGLHRPGGPSVAHAVSYEYEELPNADDNASDEEGSRHRWANPPPDVPEGCLAVYVGQADHRRFVIPAAYLTLPAFKALLEKVEEEFGFDNRGALTFPCDVETFKYILQCTKTRPNGPGP